MPDQSTTTDVARMTVILRHDAGTVAITVPVILPTSDHDARERAITMVCAAEGAPRRSVLSVGPEGEPAAPMGAWVIGHNLAGYLPESDTYAFATWADAVAALGDEARRYADEDDESAFAGHDCDNTGEADGCGSDCFGTMRATVDAILSDPSFGPGSIDEGHDWSFFVEDARGRTIAFWLAWEPTRTPDDHDD